MASRNAAAYRPSFGVGDGRSVDGLLLTNRPTDRLPEASGIGTVFGQALSEHPDQFAISLCASDDALRFWPASRQPAFRRERRQSSW